MFLVSHALESFYNGLLGKCQPCQITVCSAQQQIRRERSLQGAMSKWMLNYMCLTATVAMCTRAHALQTPICESHRQILGFVCMSFNSGMNLIEDPKIFFGRNTEKIFSVFVPVPCILLMATWSFFLSHSIVVVSNNVHGLLLCSPHATV